MKNIDGTLYGFTNNFVNNVLMVKPVGDKCMFTYSDKRKFIINTHVKQFVNMCENEDISGIFGLEWEVS